MSARTILAALLLLAAPALWAREEAVRQTNWNGTLRPGTTLSVDNAFGDVNIRTTATGAALTVSVRIRAVAETQAEAQRIAEAIRMDTRERATELGIVTSFPQRSVKAVSFSASYDITMPESAPLRISNRFGGVRITGLKASADIRNANGPLSTSDGRGSQRLENRFGAVEVRNHNGDLTITSGNGPIAVRDVTGRLDVRNRFGNVSIVRASSAVRVENGNGEVELTDIGGEITARNAFGGIVIDRAKAAVSVENSNGYITAHDVAGMARLSSSFARISLSQAAGGAVVINRNGEVRVTDVAGETRLSSSFAGVSAQRIRGSLIVDNRNGGIEAIEVDGSVQASSSFAGVLIDRAAGPVTASGANGSVTLRNLRGSGCRPLHLSATFGNIQVDLPSNANYDLNAETRHGEIRSDFGFFASRDFESQSMRGTIGSGGCQMQVTGRNASIQIRRDNSPRAAAR